MNIIMAERMYSVCLLRDSAPVFGSAIGIRRPVGKEKGIIIEWC